jgi:hypothetical protein
MNDSPTVVNVDLLFPGDGQTAPKQAHALANTTKVAREPSDSHK